MIGVARKFVGHVLPGVIKPIRVLWNEMIGFVFLVLGVVFGFAAYRKYREFDGDFPSLLMLILSGIFVLIMLGFGISSFRRAKKIARS